MTLSSPPWFNLANLGKILQRQLCYPLQKQLLHHPHLSHFCSTIVLCSNLYSTITTNAIATIWFKLVVSNFIITGLAIIIKATVEAITIAATTTIKVIKSTTNEHSIIKDEDYITY